MSRKKAIIILCFGLLCLVLYFFVLSKSIQKDVPKNSLKEYIQTKVTHPVLIGSPNNEQSTTTKKMYLVTHVADGDTVDILRDGSKVRLRLLGINAPESVAPNRPVECFGNEAHDYMEKLANNTYVYLKYDPLKPKKDEYGRELVYLFREDGLFINETMIQDGYAYEYTYHKEKYQYQSEFKQAEHQAATKLLGLWSASTCNGKK